MATGRKPYSDIDSLTPSRMEVLVILKKYEGNKSKAAAELGLITKTLDRNLREIEEILGHRRLVAATTDPNILTFTAEGSRVTQEFRHVLDRLEALLREPKGPIRVMYLPHHSAFVTRSVAALRKSNVQLEMRVLGEHHRALDHFMELAVRPLTAELIDVVIGLQVPSEGEDGKHYKDLHDQLHQELLYHAWIEVMVPKQAAEKDYFEIENLFGLPLLVPPRGTRSRDLLEAASIQDGQSMLSISQRAYESKVLVMAAYEELGTCVLPSDVALQYQWEGPLGGEKSMEYRWLPVVTGAIDTSSERKDEPLSAGSGQAIQRITYPVMALTRKKRSPPVDKFVQVVKGQVAELMRKGGRPEALDPVAAQHSYRIQATEVNVD